MNGPKGNVLKTVFPEVYKVIQAHPDRDSISGNELEEVMEFMVELTDLNAMEPSAREASFLDRYLEVRDYCPHHCVDFVCWIALFLPQIKALVQSFIGEQPVSTTNEEVATIVRFMTLNGLLQIKKEPGENNIEVDVSFLNYYSAIREKVFPPCPGTKEFFKTCMYAYNAIL